MSRTPLPVVSENSHAGQGSVLLDIGGDVGALVVSMPVAMVGMEVEIRPIGPAGHEHRHSHLAHVAVVERPVADGTVPSLVFAALDDGAYELFEKGHPEAVALRVDVVGAEVSIVDWTT